MSLKNFVLSIKTRFLPNRHQRMVNKWWADGGDDKFRFNYDIGKDSIVLDVGGYEGQWADEIFSRFNCNIFIFEPVPSFADRIRERFKSNDMIRIFSYGLGGSTRSEPLNVCADGSSLFGKRNNSEKIDIVDVESWIKNNVPQHKHISLMKINTEGGEYELLDRLIETKAVNYIENIQVQFHKIAKDSRSDMEKIQKKLITTHEPTYQYEFVWENWRRKPAP